MRKKLNKHDFTKGITASWNTNTSVGVFQWVAKSCTKGDKEKHLKKSKSIVRIVGRKGDIQRIYDRAAEVSDLLDKGEYTGPKTIKIKTN